MHQLKSNFKVEKVKECLNGKIIYFTMKNAFYDMLTQWKFKICINKNVFCTIKMTFQNVGSQSRVG